MKKVLSVLVAAAFVTVATSAMAASIVGTKHNLSASGSTGFKSGLTTQICVFCHTPHNSVATRALWNRNASAQTFTTYTSGANIESAAWYIGNTKGALPAGSPSMLCLSCHDGVSTMGNIARPPAGSGITAANTIAISTGFANLGANLTNDHPISINYASFVTGIPNTLVAQTGTSVKAADGVTLLPLANGVSLECSTCHAVHDNTLAPFLRATMGASVLCTTCHMK